MHTYKEPRETALCRRLGLLLGLFLGLSGRSLLGSLFPLNTILSLDLLLLLRKSADCTNTENESQTHLLLSVGLDSGRRILGGLALPLPLLVRL